MNSQAMLLTASLCLLSACNDPQPEMVTTRDYLARLEADNAIQYPGIQHSAGAYITSMCYTRTQDGDGSLHNPCYACHGKGKPPNYYNDTDLQNAYSFPEPVLENPFSNLFKDRSNTVAAISDADILDYVRRDNYKDSSGTIHLASTLPAGWRGYRPDSYFQFDNEGFDRDPAGGYTGWRAYRYYPWLGTFWPTNGSTDDVLIRLPAVFRENTQGQFDLDTYKLNLAIVEALVKQKDIALPAAVDETRDAIDLDNDGSLAMATTIVFRHEPRLDYAGRAGQLLAQNKLHLAAGLFPEGTEFLHSVRYLDWDEANARVDMAPRMKELRYARKEQWFNYSELQRIALAERYEAEINDLTQGVLAVFRGNFEDGLKNDTGWVLQGFIEDRDGRLRPQTEEETYYCMGCHSHLGTTTDSIFSFTRKLEGHGADDPLEGWKHWSQKGLAGIPEPKARYVGVGEQYEYSYYLQNNHSGNEFRNNDEVQQRFFDAAGNPREEMLDALHQDISVLLLPSRERALALNKGYRAMVMEQSFIKGRDANIEPMQNVLRRIDPGQRTGIKQPVVQAH